MLAKPNISFIANEPNIYPGEQETLAKSRTCSSARSCVLDLASSMKRTIVTLVTSVILGLLVETSRSRINNTPNDRSLMR